MSRSGFFQKAKALFHQYQELISYVFFGGITTLVNIAAGWLLIDLLGLTLWDGLLSNTIAWLISVVVAFVTNKLFVFDSKTWAPGTVCREAFSFFGCRVFSLAVDNGFIWLTYGQLGQSYLLMKILSNILVIIMNYVFSKLFIFRKKENSQQHGDEHHL